MLNWEHLYALDESVLTAMLWQAAIEDTTELEELHALQRELEAYKSREKQLLKELTDVRTEKENMRVAREKAGLEARDKVCVGGRECCACVL